MRNLSQSRIQEAMRESLVGAEPKVLDQFISYFPELKEGQECVLRWAPGGTLETVMAGQAKPPIADRAFTERLFGLYVGPTPIQEDIKAGIVARLGEISGAAPAAVREATGKVKSVQPNGFTITDASGKELVFVADADDADRRAGSQPQDGPAGGGREAADDRRVHRPAADGLRELRGRSPGS